MTDEVIVKSQVIEGFRAAKAKSDLYKTVAEGTAEKFGEDSRAYQTVINGVDAEAGTGSQFFFNTEVELYLPKGQRVVRRDDIGRINDADSSFFDGTFYTDTTELVLRTSTPSWKNNAKILENLVEQAKKRGLKFSPDNPLVFSGLESVRDDDSKNPYGVLLQIGNQTAVTNDTRFAYGKDSIQLGNQSKKLWTKENGLSRVYLNRGGVVGSNDDNLRDSGDNGRVVVFDAEGVSNENS